ncbi:MAG: TraB/GumN family protein [Cyclobacteriaceae bacterium]
MKNLRYYFGLALFFSFISCFGQNQNSVLWEISGKTLKAPSYVFGTIHTVCPDDLALTARITKSFAKTDRLVLELDMDDPQFATEMQQLSINSGMKNLSSLLNEDELATLNKFYQKHYQSDMSQLGILKPFVLLSMMFMKGLDCPQPASYELSLMELAKKEEKEVLGLELLTDQIGIFDKVPEKEQLDWLVKYASDEEQFKNNIRELVLSYKTENLSEIQSQMNNYPEYAELTEELLDNRNKKWISSIVAFAEEKPTFFAVGAAHLGSDNGIINLLKKEGYTVKPIPKESPQ